MATLEQLKPSISELPHEQALELVIACRASRRQSKRVVAEAKKPTSEKKPRAAKAKSSASISLDIDNLSQNQAALLLMLLTKAQKKQ